MEIKDTILGKDTPLSDLHELLKQDKVFTSNIERARPTAFQFCFSLIGAVVSAGVMLSGKVILAAIVLVLSTPLSLAFSSQRFTQRQYVESLNPLVNLLKGSMPALSYWENMAKRRRKSLEIKKHLSYLSTIKHDELMVLLSDASRDSIKVMIMRHYYKHQKH